VSGVTNSSKRNRQASEKHMQNRRLGASPGVHWKNIEQHHYLTKGERERSIEEGETQTGSRVSEYTPGVKTGKNVFKTWP